MLLFIFLISHSAQCINERLEGFSHKMLAERMIKREINASLQSSRNPSLSCRKPCEKQQPRVARMTVQFSYDYSTLLHIPHHRKAAQDAQIQPPLRKWHWFNSQWGNMPITMANMTIASIYTIVDQTWAILKPSYKIRLCAK